MRCWAAKAFSPERLRVLHIGDSFFVHSEQLDTTDAGALDALCRYTSLGQELGSGLKNPAFVGELTRLINQAGAGISKSKRTAIRGQPPGAARLLSAVIAHISATR